MRFSSHVFWLAEAELNRSALRPAVLAEALRTIHMLISSDPHPQEALNRVTAFLQSTIEPEVETTLTLTEY
jgi:hypothetical protein